MAAPKFTDTDLRTYLDAGHSQAEGARQFGVPTKAPQCLPTHRPSARGRLCHRQCSGRGTVWGTVGRNLIIERFACAADPF
jgi:hypothetical protein